MSSSAVQKAVEQAYLFTFTLVRGFEYFIIILFYFIFTWRISSCSEDDKITSNSTSFSWFCLSYSELSDVTLFKYVWLLIIWEEGLHDGSHGLLRCVLCVQQANRVVMDILQKKKQVWPLLNLNSTFPMKMAPAF